MHPRFETATLAEAESRAARSCRSGVPEIPGLTIVKKLCQGGMGAVYAARDQIEDELVAVKVLRRRLPVDCHDEFALRFEREIQIHRQLPPHPNIVRCHRAGRTNCGLAHLVMEFVSGGDLAAHVDKVGPLSVSEALRTAQGVLRGLLHLEAQGKIVHRDIKPENILLQPRGWATNLMSNGFDPKLADLGLAKGRNTRVITMRNAPPPVSVRAAAPEIFTTPSRADFRADIYGVGAVLVHALHGTSLYEGEPDPDRVIFQKLNFEAPAVQEYLPSLPEAVVEIIARSLRRVPEERYGSLREMKSAIDAAARTVDAAEEAAPLSGMPASRSRPA